MSRVRCESIEDLASGKYYLELYYPMQADKPFLTSIPLYGSHQEAEHAAVAMFQRNLPPEAISVEYGPFHELFAPRAGSVETDSTVASSSLHSTGRRLSQHAGRPSLLQRFFSQL